MDEELFHRHSDAADRAGGDEIQLDADAPKAIFEPSTGGSATEAIVSLVAQEKGCAPLELEPLYDAVDPEALDSICTATPDSSLRLSFEYSGFTVLVDASGIVQLLDD